VKESARPRIVHAQGPIPVGRINYVSGRAEPHLRWRRRCQRHVLNHASPPSLKNLSRRRTGAVSRRRQKLLDGARLRVTRTGMPLLMRAAELRYATRG
jgi:hypothetical protein